MDVGILKELYMQANRSKQVLFEMLFQMANPEAGGAEELQNALQYE